MKRLVVAGILGACVLLSACSGNGDASTTAIPAPVSAAHTAAGVVAKPDGATTQAYISALDAISPKIVDGKNDRAVDRGRNQCSSVTEGADPAKLIDLTKQRFSGSIELTQAQATQVLDVVRRYLCP